MQGRSLRFTVSKQTVDGINGTLTAPLLKSGCLFSSFPMRTFLSEKSRGMPRGTRDRPTKECLEAHFRSWDGPPYSSRPESSKG